MVSDRAIRWITRGVTTAGILAIVAAASINEFKRRAAASDFDKSAVTIGEYELATASFQIPFTKQKSFQIQAKNTRTEDLYVCSSQGGPYKVFSMYLTKNGMQVYQDLSDPAVKREGNKKCSQFEQTLRSYENSHSTR